MTTTYAYIIVPNPYKNILKLFGILWEDGKNIFYDTSYLSQKKFTYTKALIITTGEKNSNIVVEN